MITPSKMPTTSKPVTGLTDEAASRMLEKAVLVAAHPDDEVLWFSGVLEQVERVVVCFGPHPQQPQLSANRRRVRARYPLRNITWLDLPEPIAHMAADWRKPIPTPEGMELTAWSGARQRYRRAYASLERELERELAGYANIITHNPWGEYGHEDHVLVHRAVMNIARRTQQRVWYSNYCALRSAAFANRYLGSANSSPTVIRRTRPDLLEQLREIYTDELCWTWDWSDAWFSDETYVQATPDDAIRHDTHGLALNFVRVPNIGSSFRRLASKAAAAWPSAWRVLQSSRALAVRAGMKMRLRTPDRAILEQRILPYFTAQDSIRDVLFVGVDWYTKWYYDQFREKNLITLDIDRRKTAFGSSHHLVDSLTNLGAHVKDQSLDVIVCNGVIGWGLNEPSVIDEAVAGCWRALRKGGWFVLGWNDAAPLRLVRPEDIPALKRFRAVRFPPLASQRYQVPNAFARHTFDFYVKDDEIPCATPSIGSEGHR